MACMALNLRLSDKQDQFLTELAHIQGVSKNEAVLRAIEEAWIRQAQQREVRQLSEDAVKRYSSLLDRLAQ